MLNLPITLQEKLNLRHENHSLRQLKTYSNLIDFSSNDYLGLAKSEALFEEVHLYLKQHAFHQNGSTGSRLITGNHLMYEILENFLSDFHQTESALVFSSGFSANIGFFSSVPQKNDVVIYDEYSHASIREGLLLSQAKSYKFKHNNIEDLVRLLSKKQPFQNVYVVTESVFSMDGDSPDFLALLALKKQYSFHLVVDEAHAVGVFGNQGKGLIQSLGIEKEIFARIITFSKAIGCHGGAVVGSKLLINYLINFARSFIYSTGLTPHTLATILLAYNKLKENNENILKLKENISYFGEEIIKYKNDYKINNSSIQTVLFNDVEEVKTKCKELLEKGFHVVPILSPTVPKGKERIRLCLHAFNTKEEIKNLIQSIYK
jgi:8-amino-7-oxononanoate synthase